MESVSEWWMWLFFITLVLSLLSLDIYLLNHQKSHTISIKEALGWSLAWIILALLFSCLLWLYLLHTTNAVIAHQKAMEFLTGYLLEKSLSIDNIFIFLMIFNYFSIPAKYQRRVLLYGVIGAIAMRLLLILFGLWLMSYAQWVLYIFGIFLVITGIKMLIFAGQRVDLSKNPVLQWMQQHLRTTPNLHQERFFIREHRLLYATPLFLVLILIEISDLIFAVDSIPAIFAITEDPFIVFTSNIFAILGLRALYFLVANLSLRFYLLKYALALILILVGIKMLIGHWYKIPPLFTLSIVLITLISSILISFLPIAKKIFKDVP